MMSLSRLLLTYDALEYRAPKYFPVMTPKELSYYMDHHGIHISLDPDKDWVYLSCRLTGMQAAKISPWQEALQAYCDKLGMVLIDPKDHYTDGWSNLAAYLAQPESDPALVVALDYFLILRSKFFVLDMTNGPSFGTAGETIYAHNVGIPSVVLVDPAQRMSPWATHYCGANYLPEDFIAHLLTRESPAEIAQHTVKVQS